MSNSLWGDEFKIEDTPKVAKKIIKKIKEPKTPKISIEKQITSNKISIQERLELIKINVYKILGVYKNNTVVIKTKDELINYIDKSIKNGIISIDTETNNSLDPITCKIMGACIYTPEMKNAYIPINHVDVGTGLRLDWQLTEEDLNEQFSRLIDTKIIMHNGKFDYEVIKCTTNTQLKIYWDTMIGAKILDENERSAGLKQQYISKIDPSIERYSIEHLFEKLDYAIVDPYVFALYAATDAYMTYKLYEWQKEQFEKEENKKLYSLFLNIEMPIVEVAAEMELTGVVIDKEYAKRLSKKYHKKMDEINSKINLGLKSYDDKIAQWRLTEDANFHPPKKTKNDIDKDGKSKSEQLESPINISSTTQLSILLYDILKVPMIDKKKPRGTGEEILGKIDLPICKLILESRGTLKLINTYIDKLPEIVSEKTGRLHAHFNQLGAGTGRFSSSDPNLQNIPSHEKSIRMMFTAGYTNQICVIDNDHVVLNMYDEIQVDEEWKLVSNLSIGDIISDGETYSEIFTINKVDNKHINVTFK